jgi:hypothetical protein
VALACLLQECPVLQTSPTCRDDRRHFMV